MHVIRNARDGMRHLDFSLLITDLTTSLQTAFTFFRQHDKYTTALSLLPSALQSDPPNQMSTPKEIVDASTLHLSHPFATR